LRAAARPAPPLPQNDWENRVSRNSPSFAVALNWGIGSSSLNADVNALERLQIRPRPELLVLWLKVQVVHSTGKMLRSLQFSLHERLIDHHLGGDIGELTRLPGLYLLAHGLEVPLHSVDAN
jgi:hypothetical protein